ncbi:SurA N-terminal domain-containing protein [Alphaproteobacteria bacterium]|nr:SurA N-terminal domain-containing protein [Alphaproteobacteria bacterium]
MKKLIVLFFSAALGISFLFIGFGSYFGQSHLIKVGDIKITTTEFTREYENYKIEKQLSSLSDEEELYSKIQFVNQYVNQLVFEEYLNKKIKISDNSKKVVLKKSLNNEEMFNNLDEASLQNYLKEITGGINKDIFNNSLKVQELVSMDINESLLIEKNLTIYEIKQQQKITQSNFDQEFLDNYNFYKVVIQEYDIESFLNDNLITENLLNSYYEENLNEFTTNKEYSYEQVILEEKSLDDFDSLKTKQNAKFKFFENIDENLILPQIKTELEKLEVNGNSEAINRHHSVLLSLYP